jgi:replicative DNA helicase
MTKGGHAVSVTELPSRHEEYSSGPSYDRTPPQDIAAEHSVLGGMLLSKDAIADVVEVLRGHDFYRPAHETIYEAVLDLYGRGEPADAVTVAAQLQKNGELGRVGGAPYLHTLMSSVPTAANAGYYASIVREHAILRRLVEAGTRIVQMGYTGDGDADDIVDQAQAEVYSVTERRASEDYLPLGDIMEGTLDEIEAIGSRGGQMVGVPTGFADLDALTNGLHPGQMVIVAARPALGKALALDTPLPTPTGWTTMGEVQIGDELIGADGKPTRVVAATDVMEGRPCHEVEFSDGSVIVADAQHQWKTTTRASRRSDVARHPVASWPEVTIKRVRRIAAESTNDQSLVSARETITMLGEDLQHVVHRALTKVGRSSSTAVLASGPQRTYVRLVPAYFRGEVMAEVARRVNRAVRTSQDLVSSGVRTTEEIAGTLRCETADRRFNHAVQLAEAFELPERELLLPPYVLGVWLGDGHSDGARFTSADPEIAEYIAQEDIRAEPRAGMTYSLQLPQAPRPERQCVVCGTGFIPATSQVRSCGRSCGGRARFVSNPVPPPTCTDCGAPSSGLRRCQRCHDRHGTVPGILRTLGVLGNKHIPPDYLRASIAQRRALVAGLLDTDGYVMEGGTVQFAVTNRRLAKDALELVHSLGYRASMTTKRVRGRSESTSTSYCVTFTPRDPVFRLARKLARQRPGQGPTSRMIVDVRPVPSVPVRCVEVSAGDHLYLAGASCIPTHNSTLGLDLARAASIKHQMPSVIFSLEMSRNEITTRLLSAEARVPLHHMRTGQMTDEDWNRIARRTGEVSSAPLYIDDSPNMTMMEIRAKCRRLKQRHGLRLVIVDYLQLMTSGKKVESRQQEVSEFSRSLKLLAKELEVPVVAIAQLNRGPEQRTDKKPMLADLRESGCLTADTALLRADTGAPITFTELLEDGYEGIQVWSLDDQRRLVTAPLTNVFASGLKDVFRLRLRSGREVKASGNHKFLTFAGWKRLDELSPKDRLAVPRRNAEPIGVGLGWSEHRIGLLAHLIGDGCVLRKQPLHYTSQDPANLDFVEQAAMAEFGITARRVQQQNWWHSYLPAPYKCARGRRNPLHEWFIDLGIDDLRSHEKRIPKAMYSASNDEVAAFLRHLWATDGRVAEPSSVKSGIPNVSYSSTSRALADGVLTLLARFGIIGRLTVIKEKHSDRPGYRVLIQSGPSIRTFCRVIGVHGARGERAERLLAEIEEWSVNTNVDALPREVWDVVKSERKRAGLTEREFQAAIDTNYCGSALYKSGVSRERLMRCAEALDSDILREHASDDVFWDEVAEVESLGPEPVYDATVKGTHNFIADGLVAHNSLEQDSDVVILLHREDAYERESPRAGEADFIVAKHRNGPTSTITVAFQGHYSRFVDMAQ